MDSDHKVAEFSVRHDGACTGMPTSVRPVSTRLVPNKALSLFLSLSLIVPDKAFSVTGRDRNQPFMDLTTPAPFPCVLQAFPAPHTPPELVSQLPVVEVLRPEEPTLSDEIPERPH